MDYIINPSCFSGSFPIPSDVADKYLKLATETQLKVLLAVMRNFAAPLKSAEISQFLNLPESEIEDALIFWAQKNIITVKDIKESDESIKKTVIAETKPTREDVARRGNEDPKIMMLLREAQLKFGRNLKTNETQTLVWLYDDKGMNVSLILMLLEYAASCKKLNIGFIEKTAAKWLDSGIETIADAERQITEDAKREISVNAVFKLFGMERRKPSEKELYFADLWLNEWKLDNSLLTEAYNKCIDKNAKISFAYIGKILESWHKKGFKTAEDIKETSPAGKTDKKGFAAYDLNAFEKMLDSDD
mgnify:FL=1